MTKYILTGQACAPANGGGPEPAAGVFAGFVAVRPWIDRCVVHQHAKQIVEPHSASMPSVRDLDVIAECWTSGDQPIGANDVPLDAAAVYEVEELVEKGGQGAPPKGSAPGVILVAGIMPKPGLTPEQVRGLYDRHPLVALRVHYGMTIYTRNWVRTIDPKGAKPFVAFSILHFPTGKDLVEGMWTSDEGRDEVWADTAKWLDPERVSAMNASTFLVK